LNLEEHGDARLPEAECHNVYRSKVVLPRMRTEYKLEQEAKLSLAFSNFFLSVINLCITAYYS